MPKNKAIYAGSFDPFTNGHLDVVRQATDIFDHLTIVIAQNSNKPTRHYPADKIKLAIETTLQWENIGNCDVIVSDKLIVQECCNRDIRYIIRGIRSTSDFLHEEDMAHVNHDLDPGIKTIYFRAERGALSSSLVRELLRYGQDVAQYVPPEILAIIRNHKPT